MLRQFELVERVRSYDPDVDEEGLDRAYVFAVKMHGSQKRASGDPYFSHPVEVAGILTEYKLDYASIVTALLHDTIEDTAATYEDIKDLFGEEIAVCAEIASLHGTSGHADQQGLLNWLGGFQEKPRQVFVNHGDDASCENFRALLASLGYSALAPYSGTEFDLLAGKLTAYTDGVKIDREAAFKGSQRARQVYSELVSAAEDLLALVKTRRGRTNKDNAKLTAQIRSLIEKWRSN